MMDRDFPMSRRQGTALVVGLVAMAGFGVALFGGWIPGLQPNYNAPAIVTYDGHSYYFEVAPFPYPIWPARSSQPANVTFHNTTVAIRAIDWYTLVGGQLVGNVTVPNGTSYPFALTHYVPLYASPGSEVVLEWGGSFVFTFLVLVPPTSPT